VVGGVAVDGGVVSSTGVRAAIAAGDVEAAAAMMGRPHRLVGLLEEVGDAGVAVVDVINQVPGDGVYRALVRVPGRAEPVRTFVRVRRPDGADAMLQGDAVAVSVVDGALVYCSGCEATVALEARVA
jgi:hypothetical protein